MPRPLNPKELDSLLSTTDLRKRYGYCVKQIADAGALWWLESAHGRCVLGPDDNGMMLLPIWPHPDFARAYLSRDPIASKHWESAAPVEIDIHEFLDNIAPTLTRHMIAAFPIPPGNAVVVSVPDFVANIRYELEQVE